jgi:hypothetical protein
MAMITHRCFAHGKPQEETVVRGGKMAHDASRPRSHVLIVRLTFDAKIMSLASWSWCCGPIVGLLAEHCFLVELYCWLLFENCNEKQLRQARVIDVEGETANIVPSSFFRRANVTLGIIVDLRALEKDEDLAVAQIF